jgi:hypothetical protein
MNTTLIYVLLLACPVMHLFHGDCGHGGGGYSADKAPCKEG